MENYQLSDALQARLAAAAARMHVTHQVALEVAINRLAADAGLMQEGEDLAAVDLGQSLAADAVGPGATSKSLPGCEGA